VGRDARVFMGSGLDMSAICFPFGYQRYLVLDPPRYFNKGEDIYLLSTYPKFDTSASVGAAVVRVSTASRGRDT
jgi:hypothetical protein